MEKSRYKIACELLEATRNDYDAAVLGFSEQFRTRMAAFLGTDLSAVQLKFGHPTRVLGSDVINCYLVASIVIAAGGQEWKIPFEGLSFSTKDCKKFSLMSQTRQYDLDSPEFQSLQEELYGRLCQRCRYLQQGYTVPAGAEPI